MNGQRRCGTVDTSRAARRWLVLAVACCCSVLVGGVSTAAAGSIQLTVPSTSDIFLAGASTVPDGGAGTLPPGVVVTPGTVVTFGASGSVNCGPGPVAGPDGAPCAGNQTTDIDSEGSISGVIDSDSALFLLGVFVGPDVPSGPPPERLDFSKTRLGRNFASLQPLLNQTFYIGTGHTDSGRVRAITVPAGATRLFLGFADAFFLKGQPGAYGDNSGELAATIDGAEGALTTPSSSPTPTPSTTPSPPTVSPTPLPSTHGGRVAEAVARARIPARYRALLSDAMRTPSESGFSAARLAVSLLVAGMLLLLVFPAQLFNHTFEANAVTINRFFRRLVGREQERRASWIRAAWMLLAVALVLALLESSLSPSTTFDRRTAAFILGALLAFIGLSIVPGVYWVLDREARRRSVPRIHASPAAIAVAAACVIVSRAVHFQPGYLYGAAGGLLPTQAMATHHRGRRAFVSVLVVMTFGMVAWFVWGRTALKPQTSFAALVVQSVYTATFLAGLGGLVLSLIPIRFMPGEDLWGWNRKLWLASFLAAFAAFVYTIVVPSNGYTGSVGVAVALFVAFGVVSVAFWGFFRWYTRGGRVALAEEPGVGPRIEEHREET